MSFLRTDSSVNIINKSLVACGLSSVTAPFSSTDPAVIQMLGLLNDCMDELARFAWPALTRQHTLTTTSSNTYALPADFDYMRSQTGWNRTDRVPLGGPLGAEVYQCMSVNTLVGDLYMYLREQQSQLYLLPNPPPVGKVLSFEYQSRNYVLNGVTYSDYTTDPADYPQFDPLLLRKMLVLRFKEARGFDTGAAAAAFGAIYSARTGQSIAAPVLSLSSKPRHKLIGVDNIPESGYG